MRHAGGHLGVSGAIFEPSLSYLGSSINNWARRPPFSLIKNEVKSSSARKVRKVCFFACPLEDGAPPAQNIRGCLERNACFAELEGPGRPSMPQEALGARTRRNLRGTVALGARTTRNLRGIVALGARAQRNLRGVGALGARTQRNLQGIVALGARLQYHLRWVVALGARTQRNL